MATKTKTDKKPAELYLARRIPVHQLRIGDRIVTSFHKGLQTMSMKQKELAMAFFMENGYEPQFVNRSFEVKKIVECPGQWRTHVHIESGCYDERSHVYICGEKVAGD